MQSKRAGSSSGTQRPPGVRERGRGIPGQHSAGSSGRIALVLAVVGLVLIVLFIIPRGQQRPIAPLSRAAGYTATPINSTDPTSGKPIVPGVTSIYKGYTIGHCCVTSKGDWEALSDSRKGDFLRRFVR